MRPSVRRQSIQVLAGEDLYQGWGIHTVIDSVDNFQRDD
jgi:hypothetical protein